MLTKPSCFMHEAEHKAPEIVLFNVLSNVPIFYAVIDIDLFEISIKYVPAQ